MEDAERIITLRRAGFDNHTIAAMVGVETQDVRDALSGENPLPAGGGGGAAIAPEPFGAQFGNVIDNGVPGPTRFASDPPWPALPVMVLVRLTFDVPDGQSADAEVYVVDPVDFDTRRSVGYYGVQGPFSGEVTLTIPYIRPDFFYRIISTGAPLVNLGDVLEIPFTT